jgi:hypothetical protein
MIDQPDKMMYIPTSKNLPYFHCFHDLWVFCGIGNRKGIVYAKFDQPFESVARTVADSRRASYNR